MGNVYGESEKNYELGATAELTFALEASARGHNVAFSLVGAPAHDIVVTNSKGKSLKVQVKSSIQKKRKLSVPIQKEINTGAKVSYHSPADCDVIAVYFAEYDSWFIFPRAKCPSSVTLTEGNNKRLEKYREAWHYFKGA